jgi:hypothetical protein
MSNIFLSLANSNVFNAAEAVRGSNPDGVYLVAFSFDYDLEGFRSRHDVCFSVPQVSL